MAGILYLTATPIGNLEDMTFRAVRILKEADLIACEDTRTSLRLLEHYDIHTALTSYHKFNEREKCPELIGKLLDGAKIALITDAGMPAVSDPGEILVRECHANHIPVAVIPGPSASVSALALSGLDTRRFVFEGFLPADKKERRETLACLAGERRTMILYEAPHRLQKTLGALRETLGGERRLALCRELTKRYEETEITTLEEALLRYETQAPRGEYVLVVEGKSGEAVKEETARAFEQMAVRDHVALYEGRGLDRKAAMKAAAKDRGVSRRDIYAALLKEEEENEKNPPEA